MGIKVLGSGHYVPNSVLSNNDLEKLVETNDEWIKTRTGISERHIVTNEDTVDLAYEAALKAIESSGVDREEIGLIIVATFTPQHLTPSTACLVQAKLGLNHKQIMAFDLNAACTGFAYGLGVASQFLQNNVVSKALIIGAEVISKVVDWNDRNTCVLFGDGAGAVVIEHDASTPNVMYLNSSGDTTLTLATSKLPLSNPFNEDMSQPIHLNMNGQEVFKFAVTAIKDCVHQLLEQSNLKLEDIDLIVPHQANKRIIDKVVKDLKVPHERFYLNVENYGNTSAASIPIALDEAIKNERISKNSTVMLMGFGGGLTWGGCIVNL